MGYIYKLLAKGKVDFSVCQWDIIKLCEYLVFMYVINSMCSACHRILPNIALLGNRAWYCELLTALHDNGLAYILQYLCKQRMDILEYFSSDISYNHQGKYYRIPGNYLPDVPDGQPTDRGYSQERTNMIRPSFYKNRRPLEGMPTINFRDMYGCETCQMCNATKLCQRRTRLRSCIHFLVMMVMTNYIVERKMLIYDSQVRVTKPIEAIIFQYVGDLFPSIIKAHLRFTVDIEGIYKAYVNTLDVKAIFWIWPRVSTRKTEIYAK